MEAEKISVETDGVRCARDASQTKIVTGSRSRMELVRLYDNEKKLKTQKESCSYYFYSHRLREAAKIKSKQKNQSSSSRSK